METWRGGVVILIAGLAGSAGMVLWFIMLQAQWTPVQMSLPPDKADMAQFFSIVEGLSLMLGSAFGAGRITARLLIHPQASEEIAASGRWRMIPLNLCTGMFLVISRFAVFPMSSLWTWDHVLTLSLGTILVCMSLNQALTHWLRPLARRVRSGDQRNEMR